MSEFAPKGREENDWKSPRKIAEEAMLRQRALFEEYMKLVDENVLDLKTALGMLDEEFGNKESEDQ